MKPLHAVALGLIVVGLRAAVGGYDLVADPLGWLLVMVGLAQLPEDLPRRGAALGAATLALVVAAALWFPALRVTLAEADPALGWAASLPQLVALAVIALALARAADRAGDSGPGGWLLTTGILVGITAALPVLVFGAGVDALEAPSYAAAALALLLLVGLLLAYAGRPWAARAAPQA